MTRKEMMDLLLSKVPEEKKDDFVAGLRAAKTNEERVQVLKEFGITLNEEEKNNMKADVRNEISDEELDKAAGGCCSCHMPCPGSCTQFCACW